MDRDEVEAAIGAGEVAIEHGGPIDLRSTGFWKAVGAVKHDPAMVEPFADRIAAVDRAVFERWAMLTVPIGAGTRLAVAGTILGLAIIAAAYYVDAPWNGLLLLAGTVVVLVPTHGLGHLVVGGRSGIGFVYWFVGTVRRPQPGVKVDYATYLRTPARDRARMHAAGAVVTKTIPFLMLGAAWGMDAPRWAWATVALLGFAQIVTDVLWSTKSSDWKKYRREMRHAS